MDTRIRLGILGTDAAAKQAAIAALATGRCRISVIYDENPAAAEKLGTELRAFLGEDPLPGAASELFQLADLCDRVYISLRGEEKEAAVRACLEAGKMVLAEAPLALTKEAASGLFALADAHDCSLTEAVRPAYIKGIEKAVMEAKAGKLALLRNISVTSAVLTPTNEDVMTDLKAGGSFTALAASTLYPVFHTFGTRFLDHRFTVTRAVNGLDLLTNLHLDYGAAQADATCSMGMMADEKLVISGTYGSISFDDPWRHAKGYRQKTMGAEGRTSSFYQSLPDVGDGTLPMMADFLSAAPAGGPSREESLAFASLVEDFLAAEHDIRDARQEELAEKRVHIWAHRGCSMAEPENTVLSFVEAAKIPGLTGVELDVQFTKDKVVVVTHDENVRRVTNGQKEVPDYTLEELKKLHIECRDGVTEIPTFAEVCEALEPYCKQNGLKINVEFKTSKYRYAGIEQATLDIVREYGLEPYVVYSSFLADSIRVIKELDPDCETGMLADSLQSCIAQGRPVHCDALHPWIGMMDTPLPEAMKDYPVRAWNMEEPFFGDGRVLKEFHMEKYAMFGVTDIIINTPELYLK